MKIPAIVIEHRRPLLWIAAVTLAAFVLWWIFAPSLGKLEDRAHQADVDRKVAETKAADKLEADRAALQRLEASHAQDRNAQESRISELEDRAGRQAAELRAQATRTAALLAQRTQAREADVARVATASEPELHARAAGLVGELTAPETTYRAVIRLAVDRDQARDELATTRESLAAGAKEQELRQELVDALKGRLADEQTHSAQLYTLSKAQQEGFAASLAELKAKSEAEREAQDKVIRKLKGSAFGRALKTGMRIGAGIGIGIAIGKVL